MQHTVTLNNGVEMPLVGFGTFKIKDPAECEASVLAALQAGYRLIDTAQGYRNEEAVGAAVRKSGVPRQELFITSKVFIRNNASGACRESVLESLRKLGTDYLDLMLIHWPFGDVYAAWRDLEALYAEGRLRAIGVSNFTPDRFIDLVSFNKVVPAIDQVEAHLYCQRKADRVWMDKYHIGIQAYAPLGQGRANQMFAEPAVAELAALYGKTPAQVALRYLVQSGIPVIPKSVHPERIAQNIDIFDFTLTEAQMQCLAALDTGTSLNSGAQDPNKVELAMTW